MSLVSFCTPWKPLFLCVRRYKFDVLRSLVPFVQFKNVKNTHGSAAFRCILIPFERYGRPKKRAQKVLVTLFPHIFHVKPKWNIVYEYLKAKIFSRDSIILPQMHWTSNIFGYSATVIGGFLGITELSNP